MTLKIKTTIGRSLSTVLISALVLLTYTSLRAQEIQDEISFPSPIASSLEQYGQIPISLNRGTADINLPIYLAGEGLVLTQLSLTHDTKGIRLGVQSS